MIIIVSEEADNSSNGVIDWLYFYKKQFVRLNTENLINKLSVEIDNYTSSIKINNNDINNVRAVWYRRGLLNIGSQEKWIIEDRNCIKDRVIKFLNRERFVLNDYILSSKLLINKCIGNFDNTLNLNKLLVLEKAVKNKLKIPSTLITDNRLDLINFFNNKKKIITKPLFEAPIFPNQDYEVFFYTSQVEDVLDLPDKFFPSLFQEKVDKKYEVRVFIVNKKCFSMAIFSQSDETTSVDFRNYNKKRPNRTVSYTLPSVIKKRLLSLMKDLNLNTGSIDLVVDKHDNFFFLEVNPVGQYGMVSYPCNYNLDKIIANELIRIR